MFPLVNQLKKRFIGSQAQWTIFLIQIQFCFMNDDDYYDLGTEFSTLDQEGIDSEEVNIDQMVVIVSEDVTASDQCNAHQSPLCTSIKSNCYQYSRPTKMRMSVKEVT